MSVEINARFISEFNEAYPRKNDLLKEGDDHMRLIKSILKNTLPNFNREVNISSDTLNSIDTKLDVSGDTFKVMSSFEVADKQTVNMGGNVITGVSDPIDDTDAVNKQYLESSGVSKAWPVGSIYFTMDERNPSELLGVGEWERFATGRVLIGTGSDKDETGTAHLIALGAKGGNYKETLTTDQLPAHRHPLDGVNVQTSPAGEHDHQVWSHDSTASDGNGGANGEFVKAWNLRNSYPKGGAITGTSPSTNHVHDLTLSGEVGATGAGAAHNNMMPYIGVHIWKRTK